MKIVALNGAWQLSYGRQTRQSPRTPAEFRAANLTRIPATVPGNVEIDLEKAGKIKDPRIGNHIYALREFETCQWWYQKKFFASEFSSDDRIELVFEGLDCFAEIWLNDTWIGSAKNMLIPHRFEISHAVKLVEENELLVCISSAVLAGRQHRHSPLEQALPGKWEALAVRKAAHSYGWDIMPRAVSAGIWREVYLEARPATRFTSVYWGTQRTDPANQTAGIFVSWQFETDRDQPDDLILQIEISQNDALKYQSQNPLFSTAGREFIDLQSVALWWPRGYGEPARCDAKLSLIDSNGQVLHQTRHSIGLRHLELRHTEIASAESPGEFVFVINGVKIFAKGTNWVPLDALHSRDSQHLSAALEMLVDLNCNVVRCWGGNVYPEAAFYDFCDAHGILVWQDFALGCGIYPQTDAFLQEIREEARVIIERFRNHPSLALWSGNNENDEVYKWIRLELVDPNSDRISREVLAEMVRWHDPLRPYLPSSPYYSPENFRQGLKMELLPEVHLWGPRGYFKAPFYTEVVSNFVSEIGYHGCPNRETLEQMLDPEFLWPWQNNEQWLTKAVRLHPNVTVDNYRIGLMAKQITYLFRDIPEELDDFILASQINQAEALKFFIESWRIKKWERTGMLWWNLRDGWPIISDAVVDYYNRKKLAYHYIKQVQPDVCVIVGEAIQAAHPVVAVNDTRNPASGSLVIFNIDTQKVLLALEFFVPANTAQTIGQLPRAAEPEMWQLQWTLTNGITGQNHYLAGEPPISLGKYQTWLKQLLY